MIEKKRSGFSTGWHLHSQLKSRRGLLFHHDSPILLFSVVLCLSVLAALVSFDCSTCRVCTALADSVSGRETDTDLNDTYSRAETGEGNPAEESSGATEVSGGAGEENCTTVGKRTESHTVGPLQERSRYPSVAARVSRILHSGRARPVVASGILASLVLSVLLGAIFLNSDRKSGKATTPAPSKTSDVHLVNTRKSPQHSPEDMSR
ncbi:Toxoplasma gondii family C protein [Toxoplasma gondii RUB]|uniref:Toxoplasma gondii family C protein n=4 Tax=Toxoplasma gondii TaxID=5811 RepID=S7URZ5_TOXGG|nr:Toxoplasma gondii family C protein [Toxoplasma gondii GT1]KFG56689.1 Toxoplasma gondii family C protein [Toxoplasma gondii RUB]KFG99478.1 Toxoplasma gondii family C protein [Toxoplasma gondii VAND]